MAAPCVIAGYTSAAYTCGAFHSVAPQLLPAITFSARLYDSILVFTAAKRGPTYSGYIYEKADALASYNCT